MKIKWEIYLKKLSHAFGIPEKKKVIFFFSDSLHLCCLEHISVKRYEWILGVVNFGFIVLS